MLFAKHLLPIKKLAECNNLFLNTGYCCEELVVVMTKDFFTRFLLLTKQKTFITSKKAQKQNFTQKIYSDKKLFALNMNF